MESENKNRISESDFRARLDKLCGKGNLIQFPKNYKDRVVLSGSIILYLKTQKQYSEKSINEIIKKWLRNMARKSYLDYVTLRRYLVDFGLLERDPAGNQYSVSESKLAHLFEKSIQGYITIYVTLCIWASSFFFSVWIQRWVRGMR
jgi:hypothetical protein